MPTAVFRALSDPMRCEMIHRLRQGELTAGALGQGLNISQPGASQHLKVLREAGVVEVRKEGRTRIYRLNPDRLRQAHDWLSHYRAFWSDRFDELEASLDGQEAADAG